MRFCNVTASWVGRADNEMRMTGGKNSQTAPEHGGSGRRAANGRHGWMLTFTDGPEPCTLTRCDLPEAVKQ